MLERLKRWFPANQNPRGGASGLSGGFTPLDASQMQVSPAAQEAVTRQAKELVAADKLPEYFFVGGWPSKHCIVCLSSQDGSPWALLLFTSPFLAKDYIQATKTEAEVIGVKAADIPAAAKRWFSSTVKAFILDRCPRCNVATLFPPDCLLQREKLLGCWAVQMASQSWRGEQLVRQAVGHMSNKSFHKAIESLEQLRDHVNCGIPYVHQLIGMLAGTLGDQEKVRATAERLNDFGPEFAGRANFSPENLAEANVGLLMTFGMLKTRAAPPSTSIETQP